MAEGIVFSIAKNILELLSPLSLQGIGELWGVKAELEKLQQTVSTIQAVLLHAEEQYHHNPQVKNWVDRLKDAFCDAEDLLGEFYVESRLKDLRSHNKIMKEVSTVFSSSNQLVLRFKMASKLKQVRMKIQGIKDDKSLHLSGRPLDGEMKITNQREVSEHSFIPMGEIIGRDEDKRKIVGLLLQDLGREENVSLVSIVGIGGLGKTALARTVFNEKDVEKHFEPRMWVTVSDDFNIKKTVKKIIASGKDAERPEHEMDQMQSQLRRKIDGKRYLLVLDDLWNEKREEWLKLKILLVGGARGSKILITTRSRLVADISGVVESHFLHGLTPDASLDLLMQCASSKEQNIPESEKASIGKEIVGKCCGVPLAIRVIGGTLFLKKTRDDWLRFKNTELQKLPEWKEDITAVLKISYDHLPSHLKQCFAFCSLFPKDYTIQKSTLTSLWIAEGFIQPSSRGDLDSEQKAHDSFMYLLHRSFFQERFDDVAGNVISCKMHDLMHDLASHVAGMECVVIDPNRKGTLYNKTTRHLSYPSKEILLDELPNLQLENMKLRTFLSTNEWPEYGVMLPERTCHELMSSLKYLRALKLTGTEMKVVPSCLRKLKHLSYLDLSSNHKLERLTKSIKSLQNLTTLILFDCPSFKELPRDIVDLVRLTNLCLDGFIDIPRGFRKLTNLQTLICFLVREDSSNARTGTKLSELSGLNSLRGKLKIKIVGYIKNAAEESKRANLKAKQFLDGLNLYWKALKDNKRNEVEVIKNHETSFEGLQPGTNLRELHIRGYKGTIFPSWMMLDIARCLPNLVELTIAKCRRCQFLPPLHLLPRLQKLKLLRLDEVESIGNSGRESSSSSSYLTATSFPSLSEWDIEDCPKLKSVPAIENVERLNLQNVSAELLKQLSRLHRLKKLVICDIESMESFPNWLPHCIALEFLDILSCDKLMALPDRMGDLTSIRSLEIRRCPNLASLPESMAQLKSLEHLGISACDKLMALPDRMGDLTSIRSLKIWGCPNLASLLESMAQLKSLEDLGIGGCDKLMALPDRMGDLTSIRSLEICGCPNLASLPESMAQLKSLEVLNIRACDKLMALPDRMGDLTSIRSLEIWACPNLASLLESMAQLKSLEDLVIRQCGKLMALPDRMGDLTSIRSLTIWGCRNLASLPESMAQLKSLEVLSIRWCPNLASLPESMAQLKSLEVLTIRGCPELKEKYKREIGEEWNKIKHIPTVRL